jgi:N-acyl-D-aspartate/D-glutamate deacylase
VINILLAGATVIDGTGAPRLQADIGIEGDRITALGDLSDAEAHSRLDVSGLVVAPGFVDIHSHSDLSLLSAPGARSKIRQGITTEVLGNCGFSPAPVPSGRAAEVRGAIALIDLDRGVDVDWTGMAGYRTALADAATALNVATLVGHVALRVAIAGEGGAALDGVQLHQLEEAADAALDEGAVGVSTGLMYPPAISADSVELEVLGRVVARHDAVFAMHMRNYTDKLEASVAEAIAVARATGCRLQLSHLAVAGKRNWGSVARALEQVDRALADGFDVGVDVYPYLAGSANLSQLLPDWAQEGGAPAITDRLADSSVRERILDEWQTSLFLGWGEVFVSFVDAELEADTLGRSVEEASAALGLAPDAGALELIARTEDRVQMVAFGRSEIDLKSALHHEATVIGSDGLSLDPGGPTGVGRPHPRSYGCYPRLLGRIVREDGILTLERAVAMSTLLPAQRVGLRDRGSVRVGSYADLVVFDAEGIIDHATFEEPARFPDGIIHVFVNGKAVISDGGEVAGPGPGRVLESGRAG